MVETYELSACAKINLYLKVCGTLPNGYHRLDTLMQEISLSDDITIEIDDSKEHGIEAVCLNAPHIPNDKNLCHKAAVRFFSALKNKGITRFPFVKITADKKIPSEAGLGGGSTDAAAVILALSGYFDEPFSDEELNTIASHVGADTPFFLYGKTCVCKGFGEDISPVSSLADLPLIVIKPLGGVSTPYCFRAYDQEGRNSYDGNVYADLLSELKNVEDPLRFMLSKKELFVNDLEIFANREVPDIAEAEKILDDHGSAFTLMSGSGSAVFGIFEDREKRDLAFAEISDLDIVKQKKMSVLTCETI